MIPPDVVEHILRRVSIVELMSRSIVLKKAGRNYTGLCPFHNDRKNPSLSVSEEKGLYHCFSCGAGGNALTFLKEHEKLDFVESMRELAKMAGTDIEPYLKEGNDLLPLRERLKTMHKIAQEFFEKSLLDPSEPLSRRAVSILKQRHMDKKTVEKFGLGFGGRINDGLFSLLQSQGFKTDEIFASGLCGRSESGHIFDRFARRITFPVWDENGVIIAYGGRAIEDNVRAKYINSPESPLFKKSLVLYGYNLAKEQVQEKGAVLIVEGYMDVVRLFQAGFDYAAAPMGTGLTEDRLAFLKHKADVLYFCFDGDQAGLKSAYRSSGIAAKVGAKAKVVVLPADDDPDTFLIKNGSEAFNKLLAEAIDGESFVMQKALSLLPDVQAFLSVAFEYASSLEGEIQAETFGVETESFLRRCAEKAKVSFSSVELEFSRFKNAVLRSHSFSFEENQQKPPKNESRQLAALLLMYPELADTVAETIAPDDFSDEESKEVFTRILMSPEKTAQEWLCYWGSSSIIEDAAQITHTPDIRTVKTYAVKLRIQSLTDKIDRLSQELMKDNPTEKTEILMHIKELQKEKLDLKENLYKL